MDFRNFIVNCVRALAPGNTVTDRESMMLHTDRRGGKKKLQLISFADAQRFIANSDEGGGPGFDKCRQNRHFVFDVHYEKYIYEKWTCELFVSELTCSGMKMKCCVSCT